MANSSASNSASGSAGSHQDRALAEMINGLKEESINRGIYGRMLVTFGHDLGYAYVHVYVYAYV